MDLFTYGTLTDEGLMEHLIGRVPDSEPATVEGYARVSTSIIEPKEDSTVAGRIWYGLEATEVNSLDKYEGHPWAWQRTTIKIGDQEYTTYLHVAKRGYLRYK